MLSQYLVMFAIAVGSAAVGLILHGLVRRIGLGILRCCSPEQADVYRQSMPTAIHMIRQWRNLGCRTIVYPTGEELVFRGIPIALLLTNHLFEAIVGWCLLTLLWAGGHDYQINVGTTLVYRKMTNIHRWFLCGYALAFTSTWLITMAIIHAVVGRNFPLQHVWRVTFTSPLILAAMAASIAHGLHNLWIYQPGSFANWYRRRRQVTETFATHGQFCSSYLTNPQTAVIDIASVQLKSRWQRFRLIATLPWRLSRYRHDSAHHEKIKN